MKVKTLINKLKKMPQDAEVYIPNDELYIDGHYPVDSVDQWGNVIVLESMYRTPLDNKEKVEEKE